MSYSGLFIQLLIIWQTRMRHKLISHFFDAHTLPLAKITLIATNYGLNTRHPFS